MSQMNEDSQLGDSVFNSMDFIEPNLTIPEKSAPSPEEPISTKPKKVITGDELSKLFDDVGIGAITEEEKAFAQQVAEQLPKDEPHLAMFGDNASQPPILENPAQKKTFALGDIQEPPAFSFANTKTTPPPAAPQIQTQMKPSAPPPKATPEAPEKLFTDAEKLPFVINLMKNEGCVTKNYKLNTYCNVDMRTISDAQLKELNDVIHGFSITGDKRRQVSYYEAYDKENNLQKGHVENEVYYNHDYIRSCRLSEIAMYIHAINGQTFPELFEDREKLLLTFKPEFLDILYVKAYEPFKKLLAEAARDFTNF